MTATVIAAPALAADGPLQVPTVVPVPTVRIPVPTAVPTVVPLPTVQVPTVVPVPTVRLPVPTVAPPSLPPVGGGGGSGDGGSSGGGAGGTSSGAGTGGSSSGSTSGASRNPSSGGAGGDSSGSSSGGAGGSSVGAGSAGSQSAASASSRRSGAGSSRSGSARPTGTRAERLRTRERRLRETVDQRQSCLDELPSREERVLRLRAGVGPARPLTRTRVARRLQTTVRRVARLERAGLRRLRTLCAPATAAPGVLARDTAGSVEGGGLPADVGGGEFGDGSGPGSGPVGGGSESGNGGAKSDGSESGGAGGSGSDATGGSGSGSADRGGVAGQAATHLPSQSDDGGVSLVIPPILLLMALAAWALARVLRRERGVAPVATAAPDPHAWHRWLPPSTMTGPGWTEKPPKSSDSSRWSAPSPAKPANAPAEKAAGETPDESWAAARRPTHHR